MFRRLANLFQYLFRRRRLEAELDEELRSSFEMMVGQFVRRGLPPAEARRAARLEFEGLERVKERVRDGLAGSGLQTLLQDVSRRLPEMGIRMAVGASAGNVLRLILREGLGLAVVGVVLGVAATMLAARGLGSLLYQVSESDPLSYGLALLLLPAAALLGCWRPAWRAASANPAEIIREE